MILLFNSKDNFNLLKFRDNNYDQVGGERA